MVDPDEMSHSVIYCQVLPCLPYQFFYYEIEISNEENRILHWA